MLWLDTRRCRRSHNCPGRSRHLVSHLRLRFARVPLDTASPDTGSGTRGCRLALSNLPCCSRWPNGSPRDALPLLATTTADTERTTCNGMRHRTPTGRLGVDGLHWASAGLPLFVEHKGQASGTGPDHEIAGCTVERHLLFLLDDRSLGATASSDHHLWHGSEPQGSWGRDTWTR